MTKKEIAEATKYAMQERPDFIKQGERGQENVGIEDITIPRLDIIQAISPQLSKNDPEHIEGCEQGDMFNTVSKEIYGSKIFFVPVYFRKEYVIWKDRKKGGGFKGAFPSMEAAEQAMAELEDKDDCEITDTGQHFGMIIKPETSGDMLVHDEVVVSMSKSKMKISRQLNTLAKMAGGDRFSRIYEFATVEDANANGDKYQNYSIRALGYVNEAIYHQAEKLYESISSGQRDVNRNAEGSDVDMNTSNEEIIG